MRMFYSDNKRKIYTHTWRTIGTALVVASNRQSAKHHVRLCVSDRMHLISARLGQKTIEVCILYYVWCSMRCKCREASQEALHIIHTPHNRNAHTPIVISSSYTYAAPRSFVCIKTYHTSYTRCAHFGPTWWAISTSANVSHRSKVAHQNGCATPPPTYPASAEPIVWYVRISI